MGEGFHQIDFGGGGQALAAVTHCGEYRRRTADGPLHVDFVARIVLDPEEKGRAGDLFEAGVLDPKRIGLTGFERDSRWQAQEMGADERESGFAF